MNEFSYVSLGDRTGDWWQIFARRAFWPMDPRAEEIVRWASRTPRRSSAGSPGTTTHPLPVRKNARRLALHPLAALVEKRGKSRYSCPASPELWMS